MTSREDRERIEELEKRVGGLTLRTTELASLVRQQGGILKDAGLGVGLHPLAFGFRAPVCVTSAGKRIAQKVEALIVHLGLTYAYEPEQWGLRQADGGEDAP